MKDWAASFIAAALLVGLVVLGVKAAVMLLKGVF
jgi:hypothetical protein